MSKATFDWTDPLGLDAQLNGDERAVRDAAHAAGAREAAEDEFLLLLGRAESHDYRPGHAQAQRPDLRLRLLALAVGHDVGGQGDGAVQRPFQARQGLGHLGIAQRRQAIRSDLGAGQHVAQVVIDLRDRFAQGSQAGLGSERCQQIGLHAVQFQLGPADLVPTGRDDDAGGGIVGIGAELLHGAGDPLHRPHQEDVQEQVDKKSGEAEIGRAHV